MQYEAILLELMARIKKLEDDNTEIKERITILENEAHLLEHNESTEPVTYTKMTDDMIDICYKYGKKAYQDTGLDIGSLADTAAQETGMNKNSAIMYIYAVKSMLSDEVFKRAISTKAAEKYFNCILSEFGKDGLQKALSATRKHIEYRKGLGHTVDSLIALYKEYEQKLK